MRLLLVQASSRLVFIASLLLPEVFVELAPLEDLV